jgi:long-chain acyl-CoA synthetase
MDELRRGDWATMGDVGHMDTDGFLWISDRKKDLVISGGVNIFPAEIERMLIALPGVRDCIAFGIPDKDLGEALGAFVELQSEAALSEKDVQSYLREKLGQLRVPKAIRFVEHLPREDTGKLARRKAKAAYLDNPEL